MIPLSVLAVPLSLVPRHSLGRGGHIHLILHGHTPRPGYREREACATGLGIGRFSGQSRLRVRLGGKRPVAIDPERPSTASKLIKLMRRTYHRTIH